MSIHLQRAVELLKQKILSLGAMVEESVHEAVHSFIHRDVKLADKVIAADVEVDQMEVDIEEECLKILALHQPVANDLRFIVSALKINNDLERISDLAVNMAERTKILAAIDPINIPFDFEGMADKAQTMLKQSLDSMVNLDEPLARHVCAADDEVDEMNMLARIEVQKAILANPKLLEAYLQVLISSRHLERIADLATNIAEDVIYLVKGDIVRHSLT